MAQAQTAGAAQSAPAAGLPVAANSGRRLAADAIHIIPPAAEFGETFEGPFDLPLVTPPAELNWTPNLAPASETLAILAKNQIFRHEVWSMEMGFKPVRMIPVELTNAQGVVETKIVWYLLYYVRYLGGDIDPSPSKDSFGNEIFQPAPGAGRTVRRFLPGFTMNCSALGKRFESRFIPQAIPLITEKERVGKPVYDAIAIQKVPIQLSTPRESHEVWGVATWTDVDPRTDFFSVEVRGLTNAQKTENVDGKLVSKQKTLVLNFSRPGDTVNELADKIRYGVPAYSDSAHQKLILSKYGLQERLDHYWIYR
ncbi:MAG: hypothetical protein IT423_15750 [Pirellulaceae bacterium]|nr:hypothetical protein [Pirellulaceae bacterium]